MFQVVSTTVLTTGASVKFADWEVTDGTVQDKGLYFMQHWHQHWDNKSENKSGSIWTIRNSKHGQYQNTNLQLGWYST